MTYGKFYFHIIHAGTQPESVRKEDKMYKVLIAEDEEIIRKGIIFSVPWEEMECTVVAETGNGKEGAELIRRHDPDIVIADINMPVMDGLEMICETFEEYHYGAIILSGYSSFDYARKAIHYGVREYLLKPLRRDELEKAVRAAAEQSRIKRAIAAQHEKNEYIRSLDVTLPAAGANGKDPLIDQMLSYIQEHYSEKIIMQDLSETLNYSETYLNRRFKNVMNITFNEYLSRYRIRKSIRLIREGGVRIQDVAWKCGIGDYKYFNVVFKKYMGCSPREFMASVHGNEI